MSVEIEIKHLVNVSEFFKMTPAEVGTGIKITQGYIPTVNNTTVRIRIADNKSFITVKGENYGILRPEFEYEIPLLDGATMLGTLCNGAVNKTRHTVHYRGHSWHVDFFSDDNDGLITAEIELESIFEEFEIPNWVGSDVSDDPKYYNSNLIDKPFKDW